MERVETEIPYLDSLELSLTERANHLIDLITTWRDSLQNTCRRGTDDRLTLF